MDGKEVPSKEIIDAVKQGLKEGLATCTYGKNEGLGIYPKIGCVDSLEEYMANNTPNGSEKEVNFYTRKDNEQFKKELDATVNHPPHYTAYGKESIELMDLYFGETTVQAFCICSCWKYYYRHGLKGNNELTDIRKLSWYADRYLSYVTALQEEAESKRVSIEQEIKDFEYAHSQDDTNRYILFSMHNALKNRNMVNTSILAHIYIDRFDGIPEGCNRLYATISDPAGKFHDTYIDCKNDPKPWEVEGYLDEADVPMGINPALDRRRSNE